MDGIHSFAILFQLAVMILFPIGLGIYVHRRWQTSWKLFFIAAGFYLINLAIQIPFNFMLWPTLFAKQPWMLLAFTTLTYGICEETMRYLSFRAGKTMRANRDINGALMAGAGHGGTESIFFGLQAIMIYLIAFSAPQSLKAYGLSATIVLGGAIFYYINAGLSRILAIICHLGFATIIVLAYRRNWWFYPLAILFHFVVDFSTFGIQALTNSLLWTSLVFLLWAIIAIALILYIRSRGIAAPAYNEVAAASDDRATAIAQ